MDVSNSSPQTSDSSSSGVSPVREFMASVVVFLVALPLCMGIAIASGVPPALGIVTGIVGGLVVGFIAGSPLQVSGPAAGLAVIVWQLVQTHTLAMLGVIVLLAGLIQVLAGALKLGQWFRAVSPAVVKGMLAGIGVLIFASQFHVMVDDKPRASGVENLLTIPSALYKGIFPLDGSVHHLAALIGLITIVTIVLWNTFRPNFLKVVPGALPAVLLATAIAVFGDFGIQPVKIPANFVASLNYPDISTISTWFTPSIFVAALSLAIVASAETLLCATAVDQLHDGPRTNYDKELLAQGFGNMICGVFGALPMTGVIVRSSANVEAGAKTRASAILHGVWLLAFVVIFPFILALIPTACLAAVLVYIGYRLMNFKGIKEMWDFDRSEALILIGTVVGIVATDLLTGVLIGIGLSLFRLIYRVAKLDVETSIDDQNQVADVVLSGFATVMTLPKLANALEALPGGLEVHVDLSHLSYIDHACIELLASWEKSRVAMGNTLVVGWDELFERYHQGPNVGNSNFVPAE